MKSFIVKGPEGNKHYYVCAQHKHQAMSMALKGIEEGHEESKALEKGWPRIQDVSEVENDEFVVSIIE